MNIPNLSQTTCEDSELTFSYAVVFRLGGRLSSSRTCTRFRSFRFSRIESTTELEAAEAAVEVAEVTASSFGDDGGEMGGDRAAAAGGTVVPPFLRTPGLAQDQVASILPGSRQRSWCFLT